MALSKALLLNFHRQQQERGMTLDHKQIEVLGAIGGIDKVISAVLKSPSFQLSTDELQNLHNLINKQGSIVAIDSDSARNKEDEAIVPSVTLTFSEGDTFAAKWFGSGKADTLGRGLNHIAVKLILMGLPIVSLASGDLSPDFCFFGLFLFLVLLFFYLSLKISFVHRRAFKLLMKRFEWWFKIFYLLEWAFSLFAIAYLNRNNAETNLFTLPSYVLYTVIPALFTFTLFVMSLDALRISHSAKVGLTTFSVMFFSMGTMFYQHILYYSDLSSLKTISFTDPLFGQGTMTIVLLELLVNSAYILTIFLSKQLWFTLFKSTKATVIRVTARIVFRAQPGDEQHKADSDWSIKKWRAVGVGMSVVYVLLMVSGTFSALSGNNDYLNGRTDIWVDVWLVKDSAAIILCVLSTIAFISNKKRLLWLAVVLSLANVLIQAIAAWLMDSGSPGFIMPRAVFFVLYIKKVTSFSLK